MDIDWRTFGLVALGHIIVVLVGFELIQHISVSLGEIPPRGIHEWQGRKFLHWDDMWMLRFGSICLTALDALVIAKLVKMEWSPSTKWWLVGCGVLAVIGAIFWVMNTSGDMASGKLPRYDWGFVEGGRMTFAGKAYVVYWWVQVSLVLAGLYLLFAKTKGEWTLRIALLLAGLSYVAIMIVDDRRQGGVGRVDGPSPKNESQ